MHEHYRQLLSENEYTLFLRGGCHALALVLNEWFNYPLVLIHNIQENPPAGAVHVFCRLPDSYAADVKGVIREIQLLRDGSWDMHPYRIVPISSEELLRDWFVTHYPGGGLYANESFIQRARSRAESWVRRWKDVFSGCDRKELGGPSRSERASPDEKMSLLA